MANAIKDGNSVASLICASSADGTTVVPVVVALSTHRLQADDNTGGTDHGTTTAAKGANSVSVLLAVSSVDGVTPVEVYADLASGKILINSQ